MLGWLWRSFRRQIVADVPDAMAACMDCNVTQCSNDQFEKCPYRLNREAALQARAGQQSIRRRMDGA
jgi:hypothetical protein